MTNKPKFKTKYERMIAYNSILNKLKEGKTYKEVAKEFNISTSMVSTITKNTLEVLQQKKSKGKEYGTKS